MPNSVEYTCSIKKSTRLPLTPWPLTLLNDRLHVSPLLSHYYMHSSASWPIQVEFDLYGSHRCTKAVGVMYMHRWEDAIIILEAVEDMQKEKPWQRKLLIWIIDITQHVKEVTSYKKNPLENRNTPDLRSHKISYNFSVNFLNCLAYRHIKTIQ